MLYIHLSWRTIDDTSVERVRDLASSLLLQIFVVYESFYSMRTKDGLRRIDTPVLHLLSLICWDIHYHPLNLVHLLWSYVLCHVFCYLHDLLLFLWGELCLPLVLRRMLGHVRDRLSIHHLRLHIHRINRLHWSLNLRRVLLHVIPKIGNRRLLGDSIPWWELILVHSLHCHLLLHNHHLRLLRVQILLLLFRLILASLVYSSHLTSVVSLVRLLKGLLAHEAAFITDDAPDPDMSRIPSFRMTLLW